MTEVVAWEGEWILQRNQRGVEPIRVPVRSIVVVSRYGILTADFKLKDNGRIDMQSRFEPGTWNGRDPTKTFAQNLWEHPWIKNLEAKSKNRSGGRSFKQLDAAPSGGMFDELGLHEPVMEADEAAKELWRNWCELEGSHRVDPYHGWPSHIVPSQIYSPMSESDLTDLLTQTAIEKCHYEDDSQYGIY